MSERVSLLCSFFSSLNECSSWRCPSAIQRLQARVTQIRGSRVTRAVRASRVISSRTDHTANQHNRTTLRISLRSPQIILCETSSVHSSSARRCRCAPFQQHDTCSPCPVLSRDSGFPDRPTACRTTLLCAAPMGVPSAVGCSDGCAPSRPRASAGGSAPTGGRRFCRSSWPSDSSFGRTGSTASCKVAHTNKHSKMESGTGDEQRARAAQRHDTAVKGTTRGGAAAIARQLTVSCRPLCVSSAVPATSELHRALAQRPVRRHLQCAASGAGQSERTRAHNTEDARQARGGASRAAADA